METTGTIILPSLSTCALWEHELTGQFSDGMWENSGPRDHWMFWCRLEVKLEPSGAPRVETDYAYKCTKTGYNIASLYECVGRRMVNLGRMGTALASIGGTTFDQNLRYAAEDMPETLEDFTAIRKGEKKVGEFEKRHLDSVSDELAVAYYNTKYEMKHLRADVKTIKTAMKTVNRGW